ncbi:MAG TPA: plastocyanin/azurin family copper-binding protein [Thermoanaerobaculia bacterium]|jgi:plastocyanin|nr:plastocyanin/azurin family copper-binding protein [Thermoanaerobaculia bacterium]
MAEHTVTITLGMDFKPEDLSVKAGDTVTWVNKASGNHTATRKVEPCPFDTGDIPPGEQKSVKFDNLCGDAPLAYRCTYHRSMKGTVQIVK